jgi:hypothetical protein
MKEPHAVMTEDERIWKHFDGAVPRIGDGVRFIEDNQKYEVKDVFWFIIDNIDGVQSQARVVIEPSK